MRSNRIGRIVLVLASALALTVSAHPDQDAEHQAQERRRNAHSGNSLSKPVKLISAILVPGNPLVFDISWVDQARARYYLAEAGNASVDVFDAENDLFLGRITGFHGVGAPDDPCGRIQGMGPSGILVTPNNQLWAADAHGT